MIVTVAEEQIKSPEGPVVCSEKTLRALIALRRQHLLPKLYDRIVISRLTFESLSDLLEERPEWLEIMDDRPEQPLPARVGSPSDSEAATLRLALAIESSMVLLDGSIKQRAKLAFIRSEGTVSILVNAYRQGDLKAVRPMVKALQKLGHADVLPDEEMLDALFEALDEQERV